MRCQTERYFRISRLRIPLQLAEKIQLVRCLSDLYKGMTVQGMEMIAWRYLHDVFQLILRDPVCLVEFPPEFLLLILPSVSKPFIKEAAQAGKPIS